jgi:very-short-patch-repair endonuclease
MPTLADQDRLALVGAKAEEWANKLIDLGPRNTLLYFRNTKLSCLDLTGADPDALRGLLAGGTGRLDRLVTDPAAHKDACLRARSLRKRIGVFEEEQGVDVGRVAQGLVVVSPPHTVGTSPVRPLRAPLLLRPVKIVPRTVAENDFTLQPGDEVEINQVLLYALDRLYGFDIDLNRVVAEADIALARTTDPDEQLAGVFAVLADLAARQGRTVQLERSVVVGLFNYEKLPMVTDLRTATTLLAGHDLVAAMAGDPAALASTTAEGAGFQPPESDDILPPEEFLVSDADSSQQRAITTALAGGNIVIEGPPGTGKSQTIANIIAGAAAMGKTVLFVAEKRAAIEAVTNRLAAVDLGRLVFDLHHQKVDKKRIAHQLQDSLEAAGRQLPVQVDDLHRRLVARRSLVRGYSEALHATRAPWGISAFQVQAELLDMQGPPTTHRFRQPLLGALDGDTVSALADELRSFVEIGGLRVAGGTSPWCRASVRDERDVERMLAELDDLNAETLRDGQSAMAHLVRQTGLLPPNDLPGWQQTLDVLDGVQRAVQAFGPDVFGTQLDDWCAAVGTRADRARADRRLSFSHRRALLREIRAASRDGITKKKALHTALAAVVALRDRWQELGGAGVRPAEVMDLQRTMETFRTLRSQLASVALCAQLRDIEIKPTDQIAEDLRVLDSDRETLFHLPKIQELTRRFERLGLIDMVRSAARQGLTGDELWQVFRHSWLLSLHDEFRLRVPLLREFVAEQQTRLVGEFQQADVEHRETSAQRVRWEVARRLRQARDANPGETQLLREQASRKSRHLPIRRLVDRTSHVLLSLHPCWAMSPLVVSRILPAARLFDIVVFDEASQIQPHDAITAIARGHSLVVAGDDKQLPPTNFFGRLIDSPDESDDEEDGGNDLTDYESILSAMRPLMPHHQMLQWHYRSQDERLIAFSNREIYGDQLVTFPGASRGSPVTLDVVDGVASPGQDGSAAAEIQRVVQRVIEHAEQRPDESLGVITLGQKHMDRVENAIRRALAERPDLQDFFDQDVGPGRRFFVKNLERVQGDERDAVILTIGVAKRASGVVARTGFGPLNSESGRRRLNVAVTRAKRRMTVVCSFQAGDLAPTTEPTGTELLRRYLDFAERTVDIDTVGRSVPVASNGFERDIESRLRERGVQVYPQWGFSDYRIDFALAHRDHPGRMVLAVEADGDTYHRVYSTRDRDRLRQAHLENLGWRFHRVWSSAWFADRDSETDRIVEAWEEAMRHSDRDQRHEPPAPPPVVVAPPPQPLVRRGPRPLVPVGLSTHQYSDTQLIALCRWLMTDRLQRDRTERIEEALRELGFKRKGSRIVERLHRAVDIAQSQTDQAERLAGSRPEQSERKAGSRPDQAERMAR